MKKLFLSVIAIIAIAVVAAISVNVKSNNYGLSELGISNAEALASDKAVQCHDTDEHTCCCNPYDTKNVGCMCGM